MSVLIPSLIIDLDQWFDLSYSKFPSLREELQFLLNGDFYCVFLKSEQSIETIK